MEISAEYEAHAAAIADLFTATFSASEGADEGAVIGELARHLMAERRALNLTGPIAFPEPFIILLGSLILLNAINERLQLPIVGAVYGVNRPA